MQVSEEISTQYLDGLEQVLDTLDRREIDAVVSELTDAYQNGIQVTVLHEAAHG